MMKKYTRKNNNAYTIAYDVYPDYNYYNKDISPMWVKKIGNDFIIEGKEQAKQYIINYIKSNYNVAWVKQKENTIEFKIEKDLDKYFIVGYINRVWV